MVFICIVADVLFSVMYANYKKFSFQSLNSATGHMVDAGDFICGTYMHTHLHIYP